MIKVIFLDMGGVLIKSAKKQHIQFLADYSGKSLDECYEVRKKYCDKGKMGSITDEEFWLGTKKFKELEKGILADLGIPPEKYQELRKKAFDVFEPVKGAEEFLKKLKRKFTLVLFSNNTYDWGDNIMEKFDLEKYFDVFVYSYREGTAKPEKAFFEIAINKVKGKIGSTDEILYIDDKEKNLGPAKQMGINVVLFKNYGKIYSFLGL